MSTFDFIVIGSGPAGRRAAIQAAKLGKSVLVVEKGRRVGGVSVHTGTIPSKTLRETVLNLSGWRERGFYGRAYRVKQDIAAEDLMTRLHMTLDHEVEVLEHQFARNAVQTAIGDGALPRRRTRSRSPRDDRRHQRRSSGERILIAVGTRPHRPDDVPFDGKQRLRQRRDRWSSTALPRTLTVIGAGVIGVEYATIFSRARRAGDADRAARRASSTSSTARSVDDFIHQLRDRGMTHAASAPRSRRIASDRTTGAVTMLADGRSVRSEMVLYAAGRVGDDRRAEPRRLSASRPTTAAGSRSTRRPSRPRVPHIYAAGDVDRLPEPRLDLDGAGPHRRLPRLRRAAAAAAGVLSLRHLRGAGDLDRRP